MSPTAPQPHSPTATQQVSCLKCGAHWWMKDGKEVAGAAFTPFKLMRFPRNDSRKRPAKRLQQKAGTEPTPPEETVRVPIDLHELIEDVGSLTLKPDAMARAFVTLYQRMTHAPRGRAGSKAEEERQRAEVVRLRAGFAPLVDLVLRDIDQRVNEWFRDTMWVDQLFRHMTLDERLVWLEAMDAAELSRALSVPTIRTAREDILKTGTSAQRKKLRRIVSRAALRGAPGRPPVDAAEPSAVEIAAAVDLAQARLADGFELRRKKRKAGSYHSGDEFVFPKLLDMGYSPLEAKMILKATSLSNAANLLIVRKLGKSLRRIREMAYRGRRELRRPTL